MKAWLGNLKMTKKLLVSPLTAIIFLIIFGIVTYVGFTSQKIALNDIVNKRFAYYQTSADINTSLQEIHANIYKLMNWIASEYDKGKVEELKKAQFDAIGKTMEILQATSKLSDLSKREKELLTSITDGAKIYQDSLKTVVDAAGADVATASILMNQADDAFQAVSLNLKELVTLEKQLSKEKYASAGKTFTFVVVVSAVVLVVAILLSLGIALVMRTIILAPIHKTVDVIELVSQGDLTQHIDVTSTDEIGEMAGHFNGFVEKLHGIMMQVAQNSNDVASAANMLDGATEHMATGVEEAAMQVNSVATASEEMSKTSAEIAQNCIAAVKSSEIANNSAKSGEKITNETIEVMNLINGRVTESAEIIRSLGTRSEQIGEIVGLINEVADQTNLLALNAAIEAARAGEHGRGFAVVADEVRKLAERTSDATNEIRETIQAMQGETKRAVISMEEGVAKVGQGSVEASKSGDALKDILNQINKVTAEINQIAVASEQETATTNEIASSIQQISHVMQETAKRIQENAEASAKLANLSKGLQSVVNQFRV